MATVNEKSVLTFTITPVDESGNKFTPTSARWRLDDKDQGTEIVGWTAVATPSASMDVQIDASNNAIIDSSKPTEKKVFTFSTDFNTAQEHNEELIYEVVNLSFIV